MSEQLARSVGPSGIEIAYERFGDPDAPPVLLIMGGGAQMINWPEGFVQELVDRGLQPIRFDNRDAGRSTEFADGPVPDFAAAFAGDFSTASYDLSDMADDAVGLLDVLDVDSAHLVGASMGGAIAQVIAIEHPDRVRSLTSMMFTTGEPGVGEADVSAFAAIGRPPAGRDEFIPWQVNSMRVVASPGFEFDETTATERAGRIFDRGYDPTAMPRQGVAVLAGGDRTERLRQLHVPTLVMHGADDIMVDVSGGKATAAAIPDAKLVIFDGMSHSLPKQLWPEFATHINDLVSRAERRRYSGS
jgi:pimeloyl-ACP methyl ester carboxylesterase